METLTLKTESLLKPIETVYKGYRFRSRLEARWAVFFDALGIEWEYEKEGYDIGGEKGYYLPDFYLPVYHLFVEVKPEFKEGYYHLCNQFLNKVGNAILLLCRSPWDYTGIWFGFDTNDSGGGVSEPSEAIFMGTTILINMSGFRNFYYKEWDGMCLTLGFPDNIPTKNKIEKTWEQWKKATFKTHEKYSDKAKQARFERLVG